MRGKVWITVMVLFRFNCGYSQISFDVINHKNNGIDCKVIYLKKDGSKIEILTKKRKGHFEIMNLNCEDGGIISIIPTQNALYMPITTPCKELKKTIKIFPEYLKPNIADANVDHGLTYIEPEGIALVISNPTFEGQSTLHQSTNDVTNMSHVLKNDANFTVIECNKPSDIEEKAQEFINLFGDYKRGLIYFSGYTYIANNNEYYIADIPLLDPNNKDVSINSIKNRIISTYGIDKIHMTIVCEFYESYKHLFDKENIKSNSANTLLCDNKMQITYGLYYNDNGNLAQYNSGFTSYLLKRVTSPYYDTSKMNRLLLEYKYTRTSKNDTRLHAPITSLHNQNIYDFRLTHSKNALVRAIPQTNARDHKPISFLDSLANKVKIHDITFTPLPDSLPEYMGDTDIVDMNPVTVPPSVILTSKGDCIKFNNDTGIDIHYFKYINLSLNFAKTNEYTSNLMQNKISGNQATILAYYYLKNNKLDSCAMFFRRGIQLKNRYAMAGMGEFYVTKHLLDSAILYYKMAIRNRNNFALAPLGDIYHKQRNYYSAKNYYDSAMRLGYAYIHSIKQLRRLEYYHKNYKKYIPKCKLIDNMEELRLIECMIKRYPTNKN